MTRFWFSWREDGAAGTLGESTDYELALTVARALVADGNPGDPAHPELGVLAELEQRDVAAPGVARDHGTLRVGEAALHEITEPGAWKCTTNPRSGLS